MVEQYFKINYTFDLFIVLSWETTFLKSIICLIYLFMILFLWNGPQPYTLDIHLNDPDTKEKYLTVLWACCQRSVCRQNAVRDLEQQRPLKILSLLGRVGPAKPKPPQGRAYYTSKFTKLLI